MLGRHSGLSKLMNDISKHTLYEVHCFAHRLQLAVRHSFKKVKGMEENFEKFINNIYSFYNDKSFKRKESLRTTATTLGEQFWELNYIFTIRWLSSELSALNRLHKNYNSLIQNMDIISNSDEFSEDISIKASAYKDILLNPKFHTTLLFVMDILQLFDGVSKSFQDSSSTVIGKEELRVQIITNLEKLKTEDGEKIKNLVKECKCLKLGTWVPCSTSDLDTCGFKLFKQSTTITFTTSQALRQRSNWMKLSDLRIALINALAANINSYFPEGSMSMFDIFLPFKLPTTLAEVNSYCVKLNPIAIRFEANKENVVQQCIRFLTSNINYNYVEYCALKNEKNPAVVWPMMLAAQHAARIFDIKLYKI